MKILATLLCFLFVSVTLFAQNNYERGYIVRNNTDTVRGFLENSTEAELDGKISFKPDSLSPAKIFLPGEIASFAMGRDIYKTVSFKNIAGKDPVPDTSFVKQLIAGTYSLYTFLRDERRYFLIRTDTLTYFLFDDEMSNRGELISRGNYINTLNLLSIQCDRLADKYDRVGYTEKEMSDFLLKLNQCVAPGTARSYYHKAKTITEIFVFAGGLPLGDQSQIMFNGTLRFSSPGLSRQTFLNIGLQYSKTVKSSSRRNSYNDLITVLTTHKILSIPATIQYNVTTGRVRPYFYAGLSAAFYDEREFGKQINASGYQGSFGISLAAGLGVEVRVLNKLFVKADYRYEMLLQYPAIGIAYQFK